MFRGHGPHGDSTAWYNSASTLNLLELRVVQWIVQRTIHSITELITGYGFNPRPPGGCHYAPYSVSLGRAGLWRRPKPTIVWGSDWFMKRGPQHLFDAAPVSLHTARPMHRVAHLRGRLVARSVMKSSNPGHLDHVPRIAASLSSRGCTQ